jgi:GTPase KRas protein
VEDEFSTECTVENERIEVEIIDTAGQEEYRGLWAESHVQRADGFLMVYDSTTRSTFTALPTFCDIVRNVVSPTDNPPSDWTPHNNNFCFAIIGNKSDLPNRAVTASEGLAFARQGGGLFFETSAKMGVNVEQAVRLSDLFVWPHAQFHASLFRLSQPLSNTKTSKAS